MTTRDEIEGIIAGLARLPVEAGGQAFLTLMAEKRLSPVVAEINRALLTPGCGTADTARKALQVLGFPLSA